MNQKGFANIILIIIIIILVGAVGTVGYFALIKKSAPTPESPKDETVNWKIFKSNFGFSLKYPEDKVTLLPTCDLGMGSPQTLTPAENCETLLLLKKGADYPIGPPPESEYLFLVAHKNIENLPLKNFVQEYLRLTSHPYKGELTKEIIAGKEAYSFTYIGKGYALLDYTERQKWIFINTGPNKVLSVENNFTVSDELLPLFEKVISTLLFE